MKRGLFVIGTDTGVGKTLIAGALARLLSSQGVDVGVMKPIETGCRLWKGDLLPADGAYLQSAARTTDSIDLDAPYRYRDPLAPWVASQREKRKIDFREIVQVYDRLRKRHSFLIVEGVGGLMVPLTQRFDLIDLILLLDLPVLLVARSGLGTLNHTLLTLRYGSEQGLRFLGIILNQNQPRKTLADQTNLETLRERTDASLLGRFPFFKKLGTREKNIERSKELLIEKISIDQLMLNF